MIQRFKNSMIQRFNSWLKNKNQSHKHEFRADKHKNPSNGHFQPFSLFFLYFYPVSLQKILKIKFNQ